MLAQSTRCIGDVIDDKQIGEESDYVSKEPTMRDDFQKKIEDLLARELGFGVPTLSVVKATCGPSTTDSHSVNVGVASHIAGASLVGHDSMQLCRPKERSSAANTESGCVSFVPR